MAEAAVIGRVALALALAAGVAPPAARAAPPHYAPAAPGSSTSPAAPPAANGAPAPSTGALGPSGDADAQSGIPSSGDPLSANGLGSPMCATPELESQLSAQERSDCQTSSFMAAAAPTGNYAFDIHVDTGVVPGANTIALLFQELILTPVWLAFVWIVRALIAGLEWCYTLDLLRGPTMASVASALHQAQTTVTQPWLAAVLSAAALFALYHGVVRRRVAATVGEFALMVAMMAAGLWVIFNPTGTVGVLSAWSNEASLDALAAVSEGSPQQPVGAFANGMHDLFSEGIDAPWCYLEFGAVDWCRDPARLDPRLRAAAIALAAGDASSSDPVYRDAARLLKRAQTNGDLFLALPANSLQRNSIVEQSSLLYVLCQSDDDTSCQGPTATQAEFRTSGGTWARAGGLLLIAAGALGLIALLAFICLRLLAAAVGSLLYLLLAPVAVLAPALGQSGRMVFRAWATRLIGAFTAKLVYSVLLGVVLLVLRILAGLSSVGWWVQWLLISSLWWSVVHHRHRILHRATFGQIETSPQASTIGQRVLHRRGRIIPAGIRRLPRIPRLPRLPAPDSRTGDGRMPKPDPGGNGRGGGGGAAGGRGRGRRPSGGSDGGGGGSATHRGPDGTSTTGVSGSGSGSGSGGGGGVDGAEAVASAGRAPSLQRSDRGGVLRARARRLLAQRRRAISDPERAVSRGGSGLSRGASFSPRPLARRRLARRDSAPRNPMDALVENALAHERGGVRRSEPLRAAIVVDRDRLARIERNRQSVPREAGPRSRARLAQRAERLGSAIAAREREARDAQLADRAAHGRLARRQRRSEWEAFLLRQAHGPSALEAARSAAQSRDYRALGPIVGIEPPAYEQLAPADQRRARLAIDRALSPLRPGGTSAQFEPSRPTPTGQPEPARPRRHSVDRPDGPGRVGAASAAAESTVMRRERQFRELAERGESGAQRRAGRRADPPPPRRPA